MGWYPNNHTRLYVTEFEPRTPEVCPYVATNTGEVHDETCTICRGTGQWKGFHGPPIRWSCSGCGLEGNRAFFESCSCLNYGAGFFDELRAEHDMGEHDWTGTVRTGDGPTEPWRLDKTDCPLCIERKYTERAVLRLLSASA